MILDVVFRCLTINFNFGYQSLFIVDYNLLISNSTEAVSIPKINVDVRGENNKVAICHNGKELCVPGHAVEAHLKHGDQLGTINCSKTEDLEKSFRITITPNPFQNRTFIQYEVPKHGRLLINIFDDKGRLVSVVAKWRKKSGCLYHGFQRCKSSQRNLLLFSNSFTSKKVFVRTGKMIKLK